MAGHGGQRVAGAYMVRKTGETSYAIGLPQWMGEELVDSGIFFIAQYSEEGILLRPMSKIQPEQPLPSWARRD